MSIKSRLLLLILVAALPVFLLYAWSEVQDRQQRREAAEDQLLRSVRLLAAQQSQFFQRAESVLSAMLVAISDDWEQTERCNAYLIRLAAHNPGFTGLGIATPDGTIVCSSIPGRMLGLDLGERDYFLRALETNDFSIGEVQVGLSSRRAIVGLALPLVGDGAVKLVGVLGLELAGLSETISAASLPENGAAVVFNSSGTILARSPEPEQWVGKSGPPWHAEIASAGGDVLEATGLDGVPRLWAMSPLQPEKGVYAALGVPEPALLAQADRIFWRGMGLLVAVFAGAAIAASLIGERAIRRPLENLEAAVARLRGGNLAARSADVGSAPELIQLGQSFNDMAESLQERDRELEQKNAELHQLASDRELLLREMNHRIKNSLQLVSALIGLQSTAINDSEAKAQLAETRARVMAVAKVHERLYQSQQLGQVDAGRYLQELCRDLGESAALKSRGGGIACRAVECPLPPDLVIPLGIITTELATNAVKHAYRGKAGNVEVELQAANGVCRLSVSDSGDGVPLDFETKQHAGLGMQVVHALVQQLGASLEVKRLEPGTRFTIDMPTTHS